MTHPGGAPLKIKTPDEMWKRFQEYKKWAHEHPWIKEDFIKSGQNGGNIVDLRTERPITEMGFAVFLGMSIQGLRNYGEAEGHEQFFDIYARIKTEISEHCISGAMVEAYNPMLVSRMENIKDKSEIEHSGSIDIGDRLAAARERLNSVEAGRDK